MPICVLFITYYSTLEVWTRYPVPRDRQLPHRIGRTAWRGETACHGPTRVDRRAAWPT